MFEFLSNQPCLAKANKEDPAITGRIESFSPRIKIFIYEASGNPVIGETAQPHWQHLRRVMAAALSEGDLRVSVWDEHEGILRALEAGQASEAEALCRGHAEQMADILTGRLKVVISRAA